MFVFRWINRAFSYSDKITPQQSSTPCNARALWTKGTQMHCVKYSLQCVEVACLVNFYFSRKCKWNMTWLSALAMLLQGHTTAAWLWIVSRSLCLGQDESRRVQSGPCQHSCSWLHRAIFSLVALVLAGRVPFQCQLKQMKHSVLKCIETTENFGEYLATFSFLHVNPKFEVTPRDE